MPKLAEVAAPLKPYIFHGVSLENVSDSEARGDCPLCGKEAKWYVSSKTGLWNCKVCGEAGNSLTFLRRLAEEASGYSSEEDLERLAYNRGLLYVDTLKRWGVVQSPLTGDWMVPGYSATGEVVQLYRYVEDRKTGKHRLFATPELPHGLFGVGGYDSEKPEVFLCEGPWDGMALDETLTYSKNGEGDELALTGNRETSLASEVSVLATPGCNVFSESWFSLFGGKQVRLMFDNDHPRQHNGKTIEPAGYTGMKRVVSLFSKATELPSEVAYLKWGEEGYDLQLSNGADVRDYLTVERTPSQRVKYLQDLLSKVVLTPRAWIPGGSKKRGKDGSTTLEMIPCHSWEELVKQWRKAMKWTEGLDRGLSVGLAVIISTPLLGDQLWIKLIGPPSSGKSTLCEAWSVNREFIYPKDTLTGLVSGYQLDRSGSENMSLAPKLRNKTLVVNDGDTLLSLPNLTQILSQLRAFYGRNLRTQFGNKMSKDHESISATLILCGTSALRQLDASELGERCLDCVIMDAIDEDLEEEILLRVAHRTDRNTRMEVNGKLESQDDPDMIRAKQMTGGYIDYLRHNATALLGAVEIPEEHLHTCITLGKFVSFMRARPSKKQDETVEKEFAARLVSQHVRLAKCLAAVLGLHTVEEEVMRRTTRVAMDTARGRTLDLVKILYAEGDEGVEVSPLSLLLNSTEERERPLLKFLSKIGVVQTFRMAVGLRGGLGRPRWRLTPKLMKLYSEVLQYAAS